MAAVGTTPPRFAGRRSALGSSRRSAATAAAFASLVFRLVPRREMVHHFQPPHRNESESTLPKAPAKIVGQWKYANIQANFSAEIDAKKNGLVIWKDLTNNVTLRKYWSRIDDDSFLISDKRGEQGQRGWLIVHFQPNSAFAVCDSWSPGKAASALWPAAPKGRNFGSANSPIIGSWVYRLKRGNFLAQVDAQADGTAYWVDMNGFMGSKHWTPIGGNTYLISDESGIKGEKGWHVVHFPGRNGILECDDWNAGKATATLQWVRRP